MITLRDIPIAEEPTKLPAEVQKPAQKKATSEPQPPKKYTPAFQIQFDPPHPKPEKPSPQQVQEVKETLKHAEDEQRGVATSQLEGQPPLATSQLEGKPPLAARQSSQETPPPLRTRQPSINPF